jgi:protein-disulfide isomerase
MTLQWKMAALGALGGAALSIAIVFGTAALGFFPAHVDGRQVRAYLLKNPQIFAEMQQRFAEQQESNADQAERARQAAVDKAGLKTFFDPAVAYVTGPANAATTFVEFYDYDCPFCRASQPVVKAFYEAHRSDARFAFIELPIPELHGPGAVTAANASLAARRQGDKFVCFHFALMGESAAVTPQTIDADAAACGLDVAKLNADMADKAIEAARARARKLAATVRFDGTPTFIVDGKVHSGQLDDDSLKELTGG